MGIPPSKLAEWPRPYRLFETMHERRRLAEADPKLGVICVRVAGSVAWSRNCKTKLGRSAVRRQPRRRLFFNPVLRCLLRGEARNMEPPAIEQSDSDMPSGS